jgi:ABC-type ATPase involved in cell division
VVFQDFRLLDHLSVFENVALPLRLAGGKTADYAADVDEMLDWVGLGDRMDACRRPCRAARSSGWPSPAPWWPDPS